MASATDDLEEKLKTPNTKVQFVHNSLEWKRFRSQLPRNQKGIYLVCVYAHWCGACKSYTPRLVSAYDSPLFSSLRDRVKLAMVPADSADTFISTKIDSIPTLLAYDENFASPTFADPTTNIYTRPANFDSMANTFRSFLATPTTVSIPTALSAPTEKTSCFQQMVVQMDMKRSYRPLTALAKAHIDILRSSGYNIKVQDVPNLFTGPLVQCGPSTSTVLRGPDAVKLLERLVNSERALRQS